MTFIDIGFLPADDPIFTEGITAFSRRRSTKAGEQDTVSDKQNAEEEKPSDKQD